MSCSTKSKYKYLNCDTKEKFCSINDDNDGNNFDFKYVPVKEFRHIVRDVKRRRNRNKDEVIWTTFLKEHQEQSKLNQQSTINQENYKSTRTLAESFEEVDKELMRLGSDFLPEPRNENEKQSLKRDSSTTKEIVTDDKNCLLTIPEEENNFRVVKSSSGSRNHYRSSKRKSRSSRTLKNNQINCKCHHCNNDLDYHSSPDISPDRFSDDDNDNDDGLISGHLDPIAVEKILTIQRKISVVLDSISFELERIPVPDGEDELIRRQQRVAEMSTRLSRNYLYDINRQISSIKRHVMAISQDNEVRLSRRAFVVNVQAIEQKLISAHQLLLTALSAYWKHIPSSVMKNHPGKLQDLLKMIEQLKNICLDVELTADVYGCNDEVDTFFGKDMEKRRCAILSKFRPNSGNGSQARTQSAKSTIATTTTPPRDNRKKNRKSTTNRLDTFASNMRLAKAYLPKRSQSVIKMLRDKRHNFQTARSSRNVFSKKSNANLVEKCEAREIKPIKINVPLKEDDIQTIMGTTQKDLDAESFRSLKFINKSEISNEQSYKDFYQSTKESEKSKKIETKIDKDVDKNLMNLLPVVEDLLSLFKNNDSKNSKIIPKNSIETIYDYLQLCQQKSNTSRTCDAKEEIVTGEKNMRLITCSDRTKDNDKNEVNLAKFNDAGCQVNYLNSNATFDLLVSDSAKSSIFNYRKEHQQVLKSNPMYTGTSQNKPWEIISWIADELVDELISKLAEDFQMTDVIQKLFDLEFQEL